MRLFLDVVSLMEKLIFADRSFSDVDGSEHNVRVYLNPSNSELRSIIANSVEHSVRGFIQDTVSVMPKGSIVVWDAYTCDHSGMEELLQAHGYGRWWGRVAIEEADFALNRIRNYDDQVDWDGIDKKNIDRMMKPGWNFLET